MMGQLPILIIKAYQQVSRTFFPRNCRFYPSCSQYAIDALKKHGMIKGLFKAGWRILRCSPVSSGGYDPV